MDKGWHVMAGFAALWGVGALYTWYDRNYIGLGVNGLGAVVFVCLAYEAKSKEESEDE